MTNIFLKWWLVFLAQVAFIGFAGFNGYTNYILENDFTYLSFLILLVWLISSLYIGYKIKKEQFEFEVQWFSAESCMTIGMIGTVIGFLAMLSSSFVDLDVENTQAMREAIGTMAVGLGTALLTTLNGLVCSLFIKVQIVMAERFNESP